MEVVKNITTSDVQLINNDSDIEVNVESDTQPLKPYDNIFQWIASKMSMVQNIITVEPYLICYIIPLMIVSRTMQHFNFEKACRSDLNYTKLLCDEIVYGTSNDTDAETAIHNLVDRISSWKEPITKFVPHFLMLNIGAWSDRTGNRKILMLVPIFGAFLETLLFLSARYYFTDWPLWVLAMVEGIVGTLTGGFTVALTGVYCYIADVTSVKIRTLRMGMCAVVGTLGIPIGTALGDVLRNKMGYYGVFALGAVSYFIGFCYILFRINDLKRVKVEGIIQMVKNFIHPRNFWETFSLLLLSKGKPLAQILLVLSAYIIISGSTYGQNAYVYPYMHIRYGVDFEDYKLFHIVRTLLGATGIAIAVMIFSDAMKLHDAILGIIATFSKVLASSVYAYAPTQTWIYVFAVCDMFGRSGSVSVKSLSSKIVSPQNVGKIMSLIALLDIITPMVAIPMYGKLYEQTNSTFPGAIFVLGAVLTIPDFIIFTFLYLIHMKKENEIAKNCAAKEAHAYDNTVKTEDTSF